MYNYKKINLGPILKVCIYAIFTDNVIAARNSLLEDYPKLEEYIDTYNSTNALHTYSNEHYPGVFWLTFNKDADIFSLVHESFHLVHKMYDYHDIHFDIDNHEIFAYTQEEIVRQLIYLQN